MRKNVSAGFGSILVLSITILYVILVVLTLIFARQILIEVSAGETLSNVIFIPLAMVLPLFLIVSIIVNIVKTIKGKRENKPGAHFKFRLIIFFTFLAVFSSIPQGILSVNFIRTAMDSWFSDDMQQALEGGLEIALRYNLDTIRNLELFTGSPAYTSILRDALSDPDRMWENLQENFPWTGGFEVFGESGEPVLSYGDPATEPGELPFGMGEGVLTRTKIGDQSLIRSLRSFDHNGKSYDAVISVKFPEAFDANARSITDALQTFSQYKRFQSTFMYAFAFFYAYFSVPILLLSILTGFLLSSEILRPIILLESAIQRVISGDYSFRLLTRSGDELSTLIRSFNAMVAELEQSRRTLLQSEKVITWQEIAQRMAHEIKNPLTPIQLSAQRILKKFNSAPDEIGQVLEPAVNAIILEVENLNRLLEEFRDFARMPMPVVEKINIRHLIEEVLEIYRGSYPLVEVSMEGLKSMELKLDPKQFNQVFSNVVKNAFEAISKIGEISVRSDLVRKGNSDYCRIQIQDNGDGISRHIRNEIFHPYFTTKKGGTGLGLPIVERIIRDHLGLIWFETEEGTGTTFYIDLPMEKPL